MWWIVSLKSNGIYCPNDYLLLFKPHLLNNLTVEAKTQSHSSWSSPDLPPSQVIISWTFLPFIFLIQTSLLLGSWCEVVWVLCLHLSPLLVLHLWVCQHWIPSVFFFVVALDQCWHLQFFCFILWLHLQFSWSVKIGALFALDHLWLKYFSFSRRREQLQIQRKS